MSGNDALEEVVVCDPMLGHASLTRVGGASNAPARHTVKRYRRCDSVEGVRCKGKKRGE
jgi:hypothetical protein